MRAGSRCGPRWFTFAVSLILVWRFDAANPDFQFIEKRTGPAASPIIWVSTDFVPFVILTTALMPLCIIAAGIDHDAVPNT